MPDIPASLKRENNHSHKSIWHKSLVTESSVLKQTGKNKFPVDFWADHLQSRLILPQIYKDIKGLLECYLLFHCR